MVGSELRLGPWRGEQANSRTLVGFRSTDLGDGLALGVQEACGILDDSGILVWVTGCIVMLLANIEE